MPRMLRTKFGYVCQTEAKCDGELEKWLKQKKKEQIAMQKSKKLLKKAKKRFRKPFITYEPEEERISIEPGAKIQFQHGTIEDNGVNGAQIIDVISTLIVRLKDLDGRFPSKYNQETLTALKQAADAQVKRDNDRKQRGVEGRHVN